jgi:hypothetical protein
VDIIDTTLVVSQKDREAQRTAQILKELHDQLVQAVEDHKKTFTELAAYIKSQVEGFEQYKGMMELSLALVEKIEQQLTIVPTDISLWNHESGILIATVMQQSKLLASLLYQQQQLSA